MLFVKWIIVKGRRLESYNKGNVKRQQTYDAICLGDRRMKMA